MTLTSSSFIPAPRACGVATIRKKMSSGDYMQIVGGQDSIKGFFPWQVAIYYDGEFLCGGSLIDRTHILSAAHCFVGIDDDVDHFVVVLGEFNRKDKEG